jgi:hypothetical protein
MPTLKLPLDNGLPKVKVRARQLQAQTFLVTPELIAAVDNGASDCFIVRGLMGPAGFLAHGSATTSTGSSGVAANPSLPSYDVEISIRICGGPDVWLPVKLMEVPNMPFPGCVAVIGRSHCTASIAAGFGSRNRTVWHLRDAN